MNRPVAQLVRHSAGRRSGGWLVLAGVLLGVALFLLWRFDPGRAAWPICAFHATTGLDCPGCGGIRATHELLHGRLLSALRHNAFWVLLLPLVFYAVLSETLRAVRGGWLGQSEAVPQASGTRTLPSGAPLRFAPATQPWFYLAIALFAVIFGLLRNVPWYPFTLLVPPG